VSSRPPGSSLLDQYSPRLRAFVEEAPLEREPIVSFLAAAAADLPAGARIADVGAGVAPYRELFSQADYVTIDRADSFHAEPTDFDVVASADALPLEDETLDAIICTQVLEHVPNPADVLREFHRVLKPGARLLLTTPLAWEEHEMPYDFYRYTRSGLEYLLGQAGFERLDITARGNCFATLAQLVRNSRWSIGESTEDSAPALSAAFTRLDELADELAELGPLDSRRSFPLGYQVIATRSGTSEEDLNSVAPGVPTGRPKDTDKSSILYLAPWVDLGGSDKGTIDWFKQIDRDRWTPSIITTQPSPNRWIRELEPYAEEIWSLPDLMIGSEFPAFVLGFIETRHINVVHIMNSRLAFDLMPDMTCLSDPPAIVVQLHAEEHDRSGYVRYVAARYGNLVDAFSVTSDQLANAMLDYDVAGSRIHVITTGVDGVKEFNPTRVAPLPDLDGCAPRILWPGRLTAQKDPLLTLEVVRYLHDRGLAFTMHVVGDGELKQDVMQRADELGVGHLLRWHPPSHEMPRWYRSCDLVLMTSTFEGVPYVIYEALAMGVPVVAPALPGNRELMDSGGGTLIDPRDDVNAYADAVEKLLLDERYRTDVGTRARARMLEQHSLSGMIEGHEALYDHLLSHRRARELHGVSDETNKMRRTPAAPLPISFPRDPPPDRSVAVIVPCYQHGRFLPDAINSLRQ
jgi:glycosyltransferase involved in cell wall biosynthesis